ncbi:MAG TPA: zinc-ribbon domain-containing protein [Clostridiaceae bacterium]|nr:zinc-ribbon domain-containing protein [Clostridiaceae bacterium]
MSVLEKFSRKITETAKAAAKKSGDLVEVTKLNMSISAEEDKIKKTFAEIGKLVYERYNKGESVPEGIEGFCEKIKGYEENIKEMKEKIYTLKNIKICPSCNAELEINANFCSKCGMKQEKEKTEEEQEEEAPTNEKEQQ